MPCEYILFMTYLFLSVVHTMYEEETQNTHIIFILFLLSVTMFTNCLFINVL